jgi:hypothetical protein
MDYLLKLKIVAVIMLIACGFLFYALGYNHCMHKQVNEINAILQEYNEINRYHIKPDLYSFNYNFSLGDTNESN